MRPTTINIAIAMALSVATWGCGVDVSEEEDNDWNVGEGDMSVEVVDFVDFGEVSLEERAEQRVAINNVGEAPIQLDAMEATGGFDVVDPEDTTVVEPGASQPVDIQFAPQSTGEVGEVLLIGTNIPNARQLEVDLMATVPGPCLELDPQASYDFGQVRWETTEMGGVDVINCSVDEVTQVELLEVVAGTAPEVFDASIPSVPGGDVALEPGEHAELMLEFSPGQTREYEGEVLLESNDPTNPEPTIQLFGEGGPFGCPVPVIDAGESVSSLNDSVLNAQPQQTVMLDGQSSYDPDGGEIDSLTWSIVEQPDDSQTLLELPENRDHNELTLDRAGTYVVELDAQNRDGESACEPARMVIEAISEHDIYVQLVWDTPGDPNRHNDDGTDMDLHLLHPDGHWGESPYDCHWRNTNPEWGGADDGNPSLDVDTTAGWGPENILFNYPQPQTIYSVGANYFSDRGYGTSTATLRVFFGGELEHEITSQEMSSGQFWDALRIDWEERSVEVVDMIYDEMP